MVRKNYIATRPFLIMIKHISMSSFKTFDSKQKHTESTEKRKINFPKKIVENVDLNKSVLNKIMITQE